MSNQKQPASRAPKSKKLLLFPGDRLIDVLNPDLYIIVDPSTLTQSEINSISEEDSDYDSDSDVEVFVETEEGLEAPNLEDIKLISTTLITDGNKNQFVEFKFNVKNHVGSEVIGVMGYGI